MCLRYFCSQEIDSRYATEFGSTVQSRKRCRMRYFCHAQLFEITRVKNIKSPFLHQSRQNVLMSFIVENEITIVGTFSQNGFQTIKIGAPVDIVFDNDPGRIYHAKITAIAKGIGQGQVATSGMIARTNAIGGATTFPVAISIPDGMSRDSLRLGMSGNATAFAENAGVIGLLASILVWVSSYTAYL